MMKQPILKSRLSNLIDFSLSQYDLGLPTEAEATSAETVEVPVDDSKIVNEIVAKIFPNGIENTNKAKIVVNVAEKMNQDSSLVQLLNSVSSVDAIKTGDAFVDATPARYYNESQ